MAKESNLYEQLWKSYILPISFQMKKARGNFSTFKTEKHRFEAIGDRKNAGYQFNLEIEKGKVINDIGGSSVARDLYAVLSSDINTKNLLKSGHYKFNMGNDFILKIHSFS